MYKKRSLLLIAIGIILLAILLTLLAQIRITAFFVVCLFIIVWALIWLGIRKGLFDFLRKRSKEEDTYTPEPPPVFSPPEVYLVLVGTNLGNQEIHIDKPEFVIGRSRSCDYRFAESPRISRQHVQIVCDRKTGAITVMSLSKSSVTFLNDTKLAPDRKYPLNTGDILQIADFRFDVQRAHFLVSPCKEG